MTLLYPYSITINNKTHWLIWCDDKLGDHFLTKRNKLVLAGSKKELQQRLQNEENPIYWDQTGKINIDTLFSELDSVKNTHYSSNLQNALFLDFWNVFEDLARTFDLDKKISNHKTSSMDSIYEKLFLGCNLKSITPDKNEYKPMWSEEELELLCAYMSKAKDTFTSKIKGALSEALSD